MVTFAAAYLIVWMTVVLYVVRLEHRQRSLLHTIESLRSRLQDPIPGSNEHGVSKAA
jgi:CcmD family protein